MTITRTVLGQFEKHGMIELSGFGGSDPGLCLALAATSRPPERTFRPDSNSEVSL